MKTKVFILAFIMVFLAMVPAVKSQQLPVYSQYMMNSYLLNPAVAGHEGYTSLNLVAREQWIGLKDAPSTYAFSVQTRLLKNSFISRSASIRRRRRIASRSGRVGIAGYVFTDFNGAFNRTGLQASYAYHIPFDRSQLSFGLSVTGFQFRMNEDKMVLHDIDDELLLGTRKTAFIPDANVGIYYTDKYMYVGLSAMQLFQSVLKLSDGDLGPGFKMVRHYFLMGGYRFEVNRDLVIEPSVLLKLTEKFVSQLDVNVKALFNKQYWVGLSYRTGGSYSLSEESISGVGSSVILLGGVKIENYFVGYAFDYTLSAIGKRTWGSHEIIVAAKFGDTARRYRWLNRY
ncbi:MAG: type IX secretion system membrane protein PorP/SprF [Bacteroidales bacterium]|nr:type IX secretion system membrane protein PorP/SprF [Bacteroidales bacterium]MBN2763711.1 type IX secretion system membrane protein PorP/SprF [Bacteroidales bacterium]